MEYGPPNHLESLVDDYLHDRISLSDLTDSVHQNSFDHEPALRNGLRLFIHDLQENVHEHIRERLHVRHQPFVQDDARRIINLLLGEDGDNDNEGNEDEDSILSRVLNESFSNQPVHETPVPLSQLGWLPSRPFESFFPAFPSSSVCSICQDSLHPSDMVSVLPCHHLFHTDCVYPWISRYSRVCPVCRFDVTKRDDHKTNDEERSFFIP